MADDSFTHNENLKIKNRNKLNCLKRVNSFLLTNKTKMIFQK